MDRRQALVTQICEKLTQDITNRGSDAFEELLNCWYNFHFQTLHEGEDVTIIDRALELEIITVEEAQELNTTGM